MPNETDLITKNDGEETGAFVKLDDKDAVYGNPIKSVPTPEKNIGVDLKQTLLYSIVGEGESSQVDMSTLESFLNVANTRDQMYAMLDAMANDSTISAVLETYAEDSTEYNDDGRIVWAESSDSNIAKYVTFLLDSMNVDKKIYRWAYHLCKYGDVYIRLFRNSDMEDPVFNIKEVDKRRKLDEALIAEDIRNGGEGNTNELNEDVKVIAHAVNDKYSNYVESEPNPAEMFELTRFGKTYGYIKAKIGQTQSMNTSSNLQNNYLVYTFQKNDVEVYEATEYVHACLEDNNSRAPEEVKLMLDGDDPDSAKYSTYSVRRGQSLLYSAFKAWRELMLLQNSVLLNRITKSSIVRMIGVEVGDMPKEMVGPHLQGIKQLIEQKSAIKTGDYMSEYTNPGPVENNVYVPTRGGQGAITTTQIGGDVDVKSLADLDYFDDVMFGALRVPKQYFGKTDDSAGFNGGTSLSIISSRYAKMVKRIQNTLVQALTDAVNLMLIDRGLLGYINKFELHMLPPTTQEELDRRDAMSSKIGIVGDIMNTLSDVEDIPTRLKILKSLLSNAITDGEIVHLLQDEIDKRESGEESGESVDESAEEDEGNDSDEFPASPRPSRREDRLTADIDRIGEEPPEDIGTEEIETNTSSPEELPTPSDLGIDMTDNTAVPL